VAHLIWDETEVLACLEVEPKVGEYEMEHVYEVAQPPLRLLLSVFWMTSDVYATVYCDGKPNPVAHAELRGCPAIRVVDDQRGNYIECAAPSAVSEHYDGSSVIPFGLRVYVRPNIAIEMFTA
jgi:hypothetical protein